MATNKQPMFTGTPKNWLADAVLLTANATVDLTAGTIVLLATAGVDGARFDRLYLQPIGTNIATVARFWMNNGGTTATAVNNRWFLDVTLPAITNSAVASNPATFIELDLVVEAGFRLYAVVATTVASGYHGLVVGGNY